MPCSKCGETGHNARTCKKNKINENENDIIMTMIIVEEELRYLILNHKLNELTDEKIKFYETFLNIKCKEFTFINLNKNKRLLIYMINGNSNICNNVKEIKYLGILEPRSLSKMKIFTGYKFMIFDEDSDLLPDEINITNDMKDTILLNSIYDSVLEISVPSSTKLNSENESLISALKSNYLIQQMIRLGGLEDENYSSILDLHQDIKIPQHDDLDLEAAGLPNELFTNN
jgi:hypothetical protein